MCTGQILFLEMKRSLCSSVIVSLFVHCRHVQCSPEQPRFTGPLAIPSYSLSKLCFVLSGLKSRTIAQVANRWLLTASARVQAWVNSCGICVGLSGAVAGFLRALRFPLPIFIPPNAPQSPSPIVWGWYNRPEVATVSSGFSLTPLRIIKD
jgi:hypothetical protein